MPDPTYSKGVLDSGTGPGTDFLWQSRGSSLEADNAVAKEEQGNAKAESFFNHRLLVEIDAVIPAAASLPVPGQTLTLTNIVIPTVTNKVVSGTFGVGTGSATFYVEPGVKVTEANNEYTKVAVKLIRYLNHALPS
jgi:hypothetical protein